MQTSLHTYMHTCIRIHGQIHWYTRAYMQAHTYVHTYMHSHTWVRPTYLRIGMYMYRHIRCLRARDHWRIQVDGPGLVRCFCTWVGGMCGGGVADMGEAAHVCVCGWGHALLSWLPWLAEQGGRSCLHLACEGGHLDVVKYLCERWGEALLMLTTKVRELCVWTCEVRGDAWCGGHVREVWSMIGEAWLGMLMWLHTYMHTYIHTYIHTCLHMDWCAVRIWV
jgi:hypothetical protein